MAGVDGGEQALTLAALLAAWPVPLVVVGGAARWAAGGGAPMACPSDLDIVVDGAVLGRLAEVLAAIGGRTAGGAVPSYRRLSAGSPCQVLTAFCPLDVFAGPVRGTGQTTVRWAGVAVPVVTGG
jgi:hypothetical protein